MTQLVNVARNLPMPLASEVERIGYSMLRALDRLGFVHANQDGGACSVRFDVVRLYGEAWAAYHVDAERLYHFSVADLGRPDVLAQLAAVTNRPVRKFDEGGLAYVVELQSKPKARLPERVMLDLGQRPEGELMAPLGVGQSGIVWAALPRLRHTLVVGTSGSGKSTLLHSALAGLLTGATPAELQVALADPKRNEFSVWRNAPHLFGKVARTLTEATGLMERLAHEVDRRGELMDRVGGVCKDLESFNRKSGNKLPYIICIVDECLDLVGEARAFDDALKAVARRGRSAGVYLWLATQHGSAVAGLPRVVTVNLETRLVFRVADEAAARNAGCPGAQDLPRDVPGRMLALVGDVPMRLQGFYLEDGELERIAAEVSADGVAGESARAEGSEPVVEERLSKGEAVLVLFAAEELGGTFAVNRVWAKFKPEWSHHAVDKLARRLEAEGLLVAGVNGRLTTIELEELARAVRDGVRPDVQAGVQGPFADEYARLFNRRSNDGKG